MAIAKMSGMEVEYTRKHRVKLRRHAKAEAEAHTWPYLCSLAQSGTRHAIRVIQLLILSRRRRSTARGAVTHCCTALVHVTIIAYAYDSN